MIFCVQVVFYALFWKISSNKKYAKKWGYWWMWELFCHLQIFPRESWSDTTMFIPHFVVNCMKNNFSLIYLFLKFECNEIWSIQALFCAVRYTYGAKTRIGTAWMQKNTISAARPQGMNYSSLVARTKILYVTFLCKISRRIFFVWWKFSK